MSELVRRTDVPSALADQLKMAGELAKSSLIPGHLRNRPENVFIVLKGAEALGIPVFWALQSLHVVDGKLGMDAHLMRGLVNAAGHRFRVVERSNESATVEIRRKDLQPGEEPYRATFTVEDAKLAKVTGKNNWQQYPSAMLVARATTIAVRDECPELLFGIIYTPDELGAVTDEHGAVIEGETVPNKPDRAEADLERARHLAREIVELEWFQLGPWWRETNPTNLADLVLGGTSSDPIPLTIRQVYAGALALAATHALSREGLREIWQWGNEAGCLDHVVNSFTDDSRELLRVQLNERARGLPDTEPEPDTAQVTMNDGAVVEKGMGLVDEPIELDTALINLRDAGLIAEVINTDDPASQAAADAAEDERILAELTAAEEAKARAEVDTAMHARMARLGAAERARKPPDDPDGVLARVRR